MLRLALLSLLLPLCPAAFAAERVADLLATTLAAIELPAAAALAATIDGKANALQFATAIPVAFDLRHGSWDAPQAGALRWRLRLRSAGARSLSLRLEQVQIPEDASLWFYAADGSGLQGPLRPDHTGTLWTPLLRAEDAVLELRTAAPDCNGCSLRIAEVFHGFREFSSASAKGLSELLSGSCNIDVSCAVAGDWQREARATVLLQIGGKSLCSGTLVNNVRQDDRPLILTANHCAISPLNIGSVRAYFNVQRSTCGDGSHGGLNHNLQGIRFLASDPTSDFALFELKASPPAEFDVYYAGWNVRDDPASVSGAGIHHPSGDDKKISLYSSPPAKVAGQRIASGLLGLGSFMVDAWSVIWAGGTTEGGSSGSGLWNSRHQLIGVLSGGSASCHQPDRPDFYGRLERAWRPSAASEGQLKAHLDPDGRGCLAVAGKEPGVAAALDCSSAEGQQVQEDRGGGATPGSLLLVLLALIWIRTWLPARHAVFRCTRW
jgi:lysyl endopeptidase